uniref:Uncharacterized protein n=1 Tax=Strigops habroptila TaxID=2489341 RepID=A0A672UJB5_STRHB
PVPQSLARCQGEAPLLGFPPPHTPHPPSWHDPAVGHRGGTPGGASPPPPPPRAKGNLLSSPRPQIPVCSTRPRAPPTRCPPDGSRGWPPPCAPRAPVPGASGCRRPTRAGGGPPPYISPPAYDAPHRTLQLRPPRAPRSPPRPPRSRGAVPGCWSHTLPRAATEARLGRPRGTPPSPGGAGTPRHSQTLPRAAGSRARAPGGSRGRRETGGHVLIDATRVVVRAQYVPPLQRQQVRYMGGSPGPAAPPRAALLQPPGLSPPRLPPRRPGSPPAAPGAAREGAGAPGAGSPRGGQCCMRRRCVRPCPASGGTRRPTLTPRPKGARGGPGGGTAGTPRPTAAAAAAWRAPGPPRAPPARPGPERRGLAGCGSMGRGLAGCGSMGRGLGLTPIKAAGSLCAAFAPCVCTDGGAHHPPQAPLHPCSCPTHPSEVRAPLAVVPGSLGGPGCPGGTAVRHHAGGTCHVPPPDPPIMSK